MIPQLTHISWYYVGKTTLLDLLADRQIRNIGKLQGEILLNDVPVKEYGSIRKRLIGYVTQEDGRASFWILIGLQTTLSACSSPFIMADVTILICYF
jgi:hypothetical protein